MVITSDFIDINTSRERTEQALQGLEKLKSIIYLVESRYDILESDYTAMLDDAIRRVQALKSELDKLGNDHTVHVVEQPDESPPIEQIKSSPALGITEAKPKAVKQRNEAAHVSRAQSVIDAVGDAIELGLDKIGDGITFPVVSLMKLVQSIKKS